jgi:hypothetical protein
MKHQLVFALHMGKNLFFLKLWNRIEGSHGWCYDRWLSVTREWLDHYLLEVNDIMLEGHHISTGRVELLVDTTPAVSRLSCTARTVIARG